MRRGRSNSIAGFSLVEMLICLCLIGALISLLLPAAIKLREAAQRTECASNLSQIGRFISLYANANSGWIYRNGSVNSIRTHQPEFQPWYVMVDPSLLQLPLSDIGEAARKHRFLRCPAHPQQWLPTSYIINCLAFPDRWPVHWHPFAGPTKLSKVRRASDVILLTEFANADGFAEQSLSEFSAPERESFAIGAKLVHISELPAYAGAPYDRVAKDRHGKGTVNALYFDFSVRTVQAMKLRPEDFDDGVVQGADRYMSFPYDDVIGDPRQGR